MLDRFKCFGHDLSQGEVNDVLEILAREKPDPVMIQSGLCRAILREIPGMPDREGGYKLSHEAYSYFLYMIMEDRIGPCHPALWYPDQTHFPSHGYISNTCLTHYGMALHLVPHLRKEHDMAAMMDVLERASSLYDNAMGGRLSRDMCNALRIRVAAEKGRQFGAPFIRTALANPYQTDGILFLAFNHQRPDGREIIPRVDRNHIVAAMNAMRPAAERFHNWLHGIFTLER